MFPGSDCFLGLQERVNKSGLDESTLLGLAPSSNEGPTRVTQTAFMPTQVSICCVLMPHLINHLNTSALLLTWFGVVRLSH